MNLEDFRSSGMNDYEKVSDRLKESLPNLPKTLKVAATYVLERPGDIATLSMRRVAVNAGVSLPNFSRLAKTLGFETYGAMRDVYREHVQRNDFVEYHLRAENLQESGVEGGPKKVWEEFKDAALSNITALFEMCDAAQLSAIAAELNGRRNIYLVGMQASLTPMIYAKYLGGMISDRFRLISGRGGIYADEISELDEIDALVAVAVRPCARATIQIAELARERGAFVVGVTDSPASPLAINCDRVLLTPNKSPLFFDSYVGTILQIEMLIGFLTLEQSADVVVRIENIEADRRRLGEYWNGGGD